jgi:hypothetical protein
VEKPLERTNFRSEYNGKIYFKDNMNGIHLSQDSVPWWAVLNTAVNLTVPERTMNFLTS